MKNTIILLICIVLLGSCEGKHTPKSSDRSSFTDSIKKQRAIDSAMALGDRPDSEQEGPSFKEVLNERIASYHKVENIDKLVVDGADTLQLHETYYCLHDSSLTVPKHYLWGGDTTKDFLTNNFATKVVIINNRDTVLNRVFKKHDFDETLFEQLKKYAIIFDSAYVGYNKQKGEFALGYSISIPLTDVGTPAYIVVDKKGHYRILNEYAKLELYKKD